MILTVVGDEALYPAGTTIRVTNFIGEPTPGQVVLINCQGRKFFGYWGNGGCLDMGSCKTKFEKNDHYWIVGEVSVMPWQGPFFESASPTPRSDAEERARRRELRKRMANSPLRLVPSFPQVVKTQRARKAR